LAHEAIAMTEPGTGSDVQAVTTRARRDGDEYVVDGAKTSGARPPRPVSSSRLTLRLRRPTRRPFSRREALLRLLESL
jgi:Acyl-CoA dehydrogenase, middle domain